MTKIVLFTVLAAAIFVWGIVSLMRMDKENMRLRQPRLREECRRLGGEPIFTYDSIYDAFLITGCKVRNQ